MPYRQIFFHSLQPCYELVVRLRPLLSAFSLLLWITLPSLLLAQAAPPTADEQLRALQLLETSTLLLESEPKARIQKITALYRKAIQASPDHAPTRLSFGIFLAKSNRQTEAASQWLQALEVAPDNGEAAYLLGNYHVEQQNTLLAVGYFLQATRNAPDQPLYHYDLATMLYLFRHEVFGLAKTADANACLRLALDHYRLASRLAPTDLTYAKAYADTFYILEPPDWPAAISAWNRLLEISAKKDSVRIHLARIHIKQGNHQKATKQLDQVTSPDLQKLKRKLQKKSTSHAEGSNCKPIAQ